MSRGSGVLLFLLVAGFVALVAGFIEQWQGGDDVHWLSGLPKGHDLLQHYAAGRLWNEAGPAAVYAPGRTGGEIERIMPGNRFSKWNHDLSYIYPPCLAFIAARAVNFPYAGFFAGWTVFSLICLVTSCFLYMQDIPANWRRPACLLFFIFPGFVMVLICGQNSLFSLLILVSSACLLNRGRTVFSGLLIGLLAYKPQLFLGVVFFMLCAGRGKWVLAALLGAASGAAASFLFFGRELHVAWVSAMLNSSVVTQPHLLCVSWPGFFGTIFKLHPAAVGLMVLMTALLVQMLARRRLECVAGWRDGYVLYGSAVLSLLTLPYVLHYDLVLGLPLLLFLVLPGLMAGRIQPLLCYSVFWLCSALAVKAYDWHVAFVAPVITIALFFLFLDVVKIPLTRLFYTP